MNICNNNKRFITNTTKMKQTFQLILAILIRLCIWYRQPAPNPQGSRAGSQLSIIRWHLNLTLNLALTIL